MDQRSPGRPVAVGRTCRRFGVVVADDRYADEVPPFKVVSEFSPAGDQPAAIAALSAGIARNERYQTLLGITGSGKSATIAWTIEHAQRPTLVIAPNKSLAAQLAGEFREFFPENRVEYFVSYYDYYQPEAYMPASDTYIEKDSSINDEIDRLRHSTTAALLTRRDVIVVASVSCIYGLGSPEEYAKKILVLTPGSTHDQRSILRKLIDLQYERNDMNLVRGKFRVRGDTIELHPAYEETAVRIELFGDEIERLTRFDSLTGEQLGELDELAVFPARHYVAGDERLRAAIGNIEIELGDRLRELRGHDRLVEAQRLEMRTEHDLEMLAEVGFCSGIENYSRHLDGRGPGEPPFTLIDYFPKDWLLIIDESHVSVPQLRGQYAGDRSRKEVLVEHGFRLPSAMDNRPLTFGEFDARINQVIYMSATPSPYELEVSTNVVEQIVRPTGLLDPEVVIKPTKSQIDDLLAEMEPVIARGDRVLITTLTKKMAEDLSDYLLELGLRVRYLHSNIDTIERIEIIRDLRLGEFDVLVGINLLREGLDLPEVSLVAILDADKEGFLRSSTSLIQTMGRAARNSAGRVILYADVITDSMRKAISITETRRHRQEVYNKEHDIDPQTIRKAVSDLVAQFRSAAGTGDLIPESTGAPLPRGSRTHSDRSRRAGQRVIETIGATLPAHPDELPREELTRLVLALEAEMHQAAVDLRFEYAARLRDEVRSLKRELREVG
ncbi:MAG TPA: excinuclease ABC subunit UvrB [Acidimicrobiales bacterium]|nr:excinuclease ABC subunit UvrB [Acidimicrobiales bacterium]